MKKLIIATLMVAFLTGSSFANDASKVNVRIKTNFTTQFANASGVTWTLKNEFAKATFSRNGEKMEAFYDFGGELIGTSKNIPVEKIPSSARKMLAKKYKDYAIMEAIFFSNKDEDAYFISVENESDKIIFKVRDTSSISIFQKEKKK